MAKKKTKSVDRDAEGVRLLKAVARYVDKAGGRAIVLGGVSIMHRGEFKYSVVVDCTGRPPVKPSNNTLKEGE